jgi:hypothetical protein
MLYAPTQGGLLLPLRFSGRPRVMQQMEVIAGTSRRDTRALVRLKTRICGRTGSSLKRFLFCDSWIFVGNKVRHLVVRSVPYASYICRALKIRRIYGKAGWDLLTLDPT